MINPIESLIRFVNPQAALEREIARQRLRLVGGKNRDVKNSYDAGGKGRRWFSAAGSNQNVEMRRSMVAMRNVARELQRNNPYAQSALQVVVSSTVGGGIKPVAICINKKKKKLADELMTEWANSVSCDLDGRLNLFGLQALAMQTESLSGEALVVRRMVNDPALRVPLKLQLLEGDYLDHQKDAEIEGNKIAIQGVQINDGKREGYWLHKAHPGESTAVRTLSHFVSADQVAHIYEVIRPGQVRGVPRGVAAFTRLKQLDDYQDARLELQKMASCLGGFIYQDVEAENKFEGDTLPDRLEPGMLARLQGDERITFNTPPASGDHASFILPEQRTIASAWGITYESLTGDYSQVNFASGKMGRLQMFSNIHRWRHNMLIPQFCKTIERWFLEAAALRGFDLSGVSFDWTPPRKEILDPAAEIPAIIKEVRAGLNSFPSACRERGIDWKQLLTEWKEFSDELDKLGLVLDIDPRRTTSSGQMQTAVNAGEGVDLTTKDQGVPDDETIQ
jgi:lambda family phage portal protein